MKSTCTLISFLQVLRNFDSLISSNCTKELQNSGVDLWKNSQVKSVRKTEKGLEVTLVSKDPEKKSEEEKTRTIQEVDCLLWAIGRQPNTSGLNIGEMVTVCCALSTDKLKTDRSTWRGDNKSGHLEYISVFFFGQFNKESKVYLVNFAERCLKNLTLTIKITTITN